jgi:hypothetical protein
MRFSYFMVANKLKELEAARAKVAALEQEVEAEMRAELAGLPARFGFDNVKAFLRAVRASSGKRGVARAATPSSKRAARRKRAVVTDAMRAEVKKLVNEGKTGGEIAKSVGVSLPTVQNIKKALGLVKKRG